jgi:hypothetical protein
VSSATDVYAFTGNFGDADAVFAKGSLFHGNVWLGGLGAARRYLQVSRCAAELDCLWHIYGIIMPWRECG